MLSDRGDDQLSVKTAVLYVNAAYRIVKFDSDEEPLASDLFYMRQGL